jgi:hypothetical protein
MSKTRIDLTPKRDEREREREREREERYGAKKQKCGSI